jgi:zinc-binding in reverse transcriptase
VLTKFNLAKRGWLGSTKCVFCDLEESTNYLFVSCPLVNKIWQWIVQYNNFNFEGDNIQDLLACFTIGGWNSFNVGAGITRGRGISGRDG